jgi:predicted RNA-binding Zn-ribbon protein involved in translation (DUF1610 family)
MQEEEDCPHPNRLVYGETYYKEVKGDCVDYEKEVGHQVLTHLRDLTNTVYHKCPNCGAILPEIQLHTKDSIFTLTCTKIADKKGKVIAETDYEQLEGYLHSYNKHLPPEKTN